MWVLGGGRTADEMDHAWIGITHLDQEGYERLLVEREGQQQQVAQAAGQLTRAPLALPELAGEMGVEGAT